MPEHDEAEGNQDEAEIVFVANEVESGDENQDDLEGLKCGEEREQWNRRVHDRQETGAAIKHVEPESWREEAEVFPVPEHVSENQDDSGDFGPIEVKTAAVAAVKDGMDRKSPFLGMPDATGDHEAHGQENEALQEGLLTDEKTGDWREDTIGKDEYLRLLKIERLQINESGIFHASLL